MNKFNWPKLTRPDLQAHIYSKALLENVSNLRSLCKPGTKYCAVVKANAYGHGIAEVVNILRETDIEFFAVTSIYEAFHIHDMVGDKQILILTPMSPLQAPEQIHYCAHHKFHCVVTSVRAAKVVISTLEGTDEIIDLHINVETGMGRCGADVEEAKKIIDMIDKSKNTNLAGVFTHFATADEEDLSYAYEQLARYIEFLSQTGLDLRKEVIVHAANSAATIKMPESHFDMVRCGISMYGYYSRQMQNPPIRLRPVMKLQAPLTGIKNIPKGHSVSYGRSFIAERDTTIGIVPFGYADGYWRIFANKTKMKIGDAIINQVGRVCMDQLLVDITDVPDVRLGAMVTIVDDDHNSPCGVYALAKEAGTIAYEILTFVHAHVNRIVH